MAWAINGTPDTLTVAGDVLTISDLTALKFNQFLFHGLSSGAIAANVTFDNNSNTDYALRENTDGT